VKLRRRVDGDGRKILHPAHWGIATLHFSFYLLWEAEMWGYLQDHPAALTAFKTKESLGAIALTDQLLRASGKVRTRAMLAWALFRKGPLTTTGCDHGAFVSTTGAERLFSHLCAEDGDEGTVLGSCGLSKVLCTG
jgi:hypothetical protein